MTKPLDASTKLQRKEESGMWFELKGDARLGRCASEGCGGSPVWRLEARGTGSNYCSGCKKKIDNEVARSEPFHDLAYINPRLYNQFF